MARGEILLKRKIAFLHICLITWCKIVERRLVVIVMIIIIMMTLMLLTVFSIYFSAIFSVIAYCNDLYSYFFFASYISCNIVIAY